MLMLMPGMSVVGMALLWLRALLIAGGRVRGSDASESRGSCRLSVRRYS